MGDRHRGAASVPHNLHASVKLLGESRDDGRAQSGTWLVRVQLALRHSNAVIGNRKLPARFSRLIGNDNQACDACLNALITSSATMRPMLTASADEAPPPSAWTFNKMGRLLSAIEAARAWDNRER
jgi:hypothetical protein